MCDELGSATDIDRLLVPSGLSTPIATLIGNDDFWSCHTYFRLTMSPKIGNFEFFLGYFCEIESESLSAWACMCTIVPRSVLPIVKSHSAVVDEVRL